MAANEREEDALAYGEYHGRGPATEEENYQGGDRGIIGDTYRRWRDRHQPQPMQNQNYGAVSYFLVMSIKQDELLIEYDFVVVLRSTREYGPNLPIQPLR